MSRMRLTPVPGIGIVLGVALGVVAAVGCGPTAGGTNTPTNGGGGPTVTPDPVGPGDDRSMGALKRELDAFTRKKQSMVTASTSDPAVCEELCSLATDICEVQQKLCDLADEHAGDDEYQNLCREARNECREAQESCVRCVESNR